MYEEHVYLFHPSILRASRQIEREASHILYNENSLVRVSTSASRYWEVIGFGLRGKMDGHGIPILATSERAYSFTRHTMELVLLRKGVPSQHLDMIKRMFIIASDDLQSFCHSLLMLNTSSGDLNKFILAIEVFTERTAAIAAPHQKLRQMMTQIDDQGLLRGNCFIEATTSTKDDNSTPSEISPVGKTPTEEGPLTLHQTISPSEHQTVSPSEHANSIVSSPRVLKLLEPLCKLHSLHGVYIEGPIGDDHKTALLLSMLGPPPSDLELLDELLSKFKDAMSTYDRGDQEAGMVKLKLTLDTIRDQMSARALDWSGDAVVPQGAPYAGYTVRGAQRDIEVQVWTIMAWKFLEIGTDPHVSVAQQFAHLILRKRSNPNSYWNSPPKGNKAAMAFYLAAHASEAQGKLKGTLRFRSLEEVIKYLLAGLRHEPENPIMKRELEEKMDELKMLRLLQKELKDRGSTLKELDTL